MLWLDRAGDRPRRVLDDGGGEDTDPLPKEDAAAAAGR